MDTEDIGHLITVTIPGRRISKDLRISAARRTVIGMKTIFSPCMKFNHIESHSFLLNILSHAFDKAHVIFGYTWEEF